jgi:hypothetical protein
MMVYVSVKELLPSAFRFDPKDSVVSTSEWQGEGVGEGAHARGDAAPSTPLHALSPCQLAWTSLFLPRRHSGWNGGDGHLPGALHALSVKR